ncbi:MAG TPA: CBS domain-containing protein, partial [Thermoplasmatales archaeon]|nr:CBS domain-containing protein [Thermoplasmatales archaeon]
VKEVMRAKVITVEPNTTVREAAQLMRKKKVGSVIVVEDKPVGILTESDIIEKIVAEDKKASDVLVKEIMTSPIIVIDPYIDLEEAMKTMSTCNIRRLPVIENGRLIGIITQKDVLRFSPTLLEISREWSKIESDVPYRESQIFSGKCEDCGALSTNLREVDGRLLCEDCAEAAKYGE